MQDQSQFPNSPPGSAGLHIQGSQDQKSRSTEERYGMEFPYAKSMEI